MTEFIFTFLIISFLYAIRLYISIGSRVDIRDILLCSMLGPSVLWLKIYGSVLSFCGIQVYYMIGFDEDKKDSSV